MNPTDEQKKIIAHTGNRVVTANPGSGKTFTLSTIIRNILPEQPSFKGVIAISFTNKASNELRHRCLKDGLDKKGSFFGTIDSFFISEIVFPFISHIWGIRVPQIKSFFEVEQELVDSGLNIVDLKNDLSSKNFHDYQDHIELLKAIYENGYCLLETIGCLGNFIFDNSAACRKYLAAKYSHVIVDEYQDSDVFQHDLFLKLKDLGLTCIAVGDVNQSIFVFAGKSPDHLIELTGNADFKTFPLTRNMRCHPSITNYSLQLISKNPALLETSETRLYHAHYKGDELVIAKWVDDKIVKVKNHFSVSYHNQVAFLFKSNRSAEFFGELIQTPYKFLRSTPLDEDSAPWSTVFKSTLNYIFNENETKTEIIRSSTAELTRAKLKQLSKDFDLLKSLSVSPEALLQNLEVFTRISKILHPDHDDTKAVLLLESVLSEENLIQSYVPPQENEIQLMTLHKSKGLEFKIVFHMDLYDWILPGFDAMKGSRSHLLQDLNLHYVGITRAIEACFLVSSSTRTNNSNEKKLGTPSNFLNSDKLISLRKYQAY